MPTVAQQLIIAAILLNHLACTDAELLMHPGSIPPSNQIRLSDAKDMDDLVTDDAQVNLTDKLSPPDTHDAVFFGEADQYESDDPDTIAAATPLIAVHPGKLWKALALDRSDLADDGWKYVGSGPAPREVWGVLDTVAGDARNTFVVVHSTDGAATFTLKTYTKPASIADIYDFAMTRDGHGRITLSLDADCVGAKAGLYYYETSDHGKTWSTTPRFEPDAMVRAAFVSDGEQPTPADKPIRVMLHSRSGRAAGALFIRPAKKRALLPTRSPMHSPWANP